LSGSESVLQGPRSGRSGCAHRRPATAVEPSSAGWPGRGHAPTFVPQVAMPGTGQDLSVDGVSGPMLSSLAYCWTVVPRPQGRSAYGCALPRPHGLRATCSPPTLHACCRLKLRRQGWPAKSARPPSNGCGPRNTWACAAIDEPRWWMGQLPEDRLCKAPIPFATPPGVCGDPPSCPPLAPPPVRCLRSSGPPTAAP